MTVRRDRALNEGVATKEAKPQLKQPPLYKVVILNDDYTPMDFVVEVLQKFFGLDSEKATQILLHVHTRGAGVCGVYTRDVAETKGGRGGGGARGGRRPRK